jgi:hypothetical protein
MTLCPFTGSPCFVLYQQGSGWQLNHSCSSGQLSEPSFTQYEGKQETCSISNSGSNEALAITETHKMMQQLWPAGWQHTSLSSTCSSSQHSSNKPRPDTPQNQPSTSNHSSQASHRGSACGLPAGSKVSQAAIGRPSSSTGGMTNKLLKGHHAVALVPLYFL